MKLLKIQNYREIDVAIFHGVLVLAVLAVITIGMNVNGVILGAISLIDMFWVYLILTTRKECSKYQEVVYACDIESCFEELFKAGMIYESNIGRQYTFITNYRLLRQERLLVIQEGKENNQLKLLLPASLMYLQNSILGKKSYVNNIGKENAH